MNETAILEQMRALVRGIVRKEVAVEMDTDFRRDLHLDSLKLLELVVAVENHFEVRLEAGDEEGLDTVGDVVRFLAGRVPG